MGIFNGDQLNQLKGKVLILCIQDITGASDNQIMLLCLPGIPVIIFCLFVFLLLLLSSSRMILNQSKTDR